MLRPGSGPDSGMKEVSIELPQVPLRAVQDHALRAAAADAPLQEEVPHLVLRGQAKDTGNSVEDVYLILFSQ